MSKEGGNTDEKINKAIQDVLIQYKNIEKKDQNNVQQINVNSTTIYIIPVKLLGHNGCGLYFVHPSYEIYPSKDGQTPEYSTAYVIPQDPTELCDYTNINYIDVPIAYRGNGIASKLLKAVHDWCIKQQNFTLIRLENDTDINEHTGLPSTLYEKAGYHYLNKNIEYKFGDKTIMRSGGNEMEKVLNGGNHSEDCQFIDSYIVSTEVNRATKYEDESKAEQLVCEQSEKKKRKRNHWEHINPDNIIGNINATVLRCRKSIPKGQCTSKPKHKAQSTSISLSKFSRRIKGKRSRSRSGTRSKLKSKTSRSGTRSKLKSKRSRSGYRSKVKANRSTSAGRSKLRANTKNKSRRIKV